VIDVTINGNHTAVASGTTILDAARKLDIVLESPCNGNGTCGKCKVIVNGESVLACQTAITVPAEIITESKEHENKTLQILSGGNSFSYPLKPAFSDGYGLVVDIGTTTLVAALIDLSTGKQLDSESRLNPQTVFAQDVLSRISYASEPDGLLRLKGDLLHVLNEMVANMCEFAEVSPSSIHEAVYSGNTAMLHLACGIDPAPLGKYPYNVPLECGLSVVDAELDIIGEIYLPPIISAFVGADITSGILASRLHEQTQTTLFIDIGTNGEMVIANGGTLAATSTAAGPAFEGMNITCGMRAARGAIEKFHINVDDSVTYAVIGGEAEPTGICGSGLLDIAAELVRTGKIGKTGRFADKSKQYNITEKVFITQNDIRQIQLAKGAIRTGIDALLRELNLSVTDVARVEIAGSFGYHLSESSLLDIKLLPPEFKGKIHFVGNTAQSGGTAFLLNTDFRSEMLDIVSRVRKIELANNDDFQREFIASLNF
jgi:uncharacterized 2Fe-2S/4Fe-4S cluster protein (DUF4445 family)